MLTRLRRNFVTCAALAAGLTGSILASPGADAQDDSLTLSQWSEQVWQSATRGDFDALQKSFSREPIGFNDARLARLRETLVQYRENRKKAEAERIEERDAALEELREHLAEDDLSQALRSAVKYQSLSADYDAALEVEEIETVVERSKDAIPAAKEQRDWLYAQELLFRLRTLYDDTSERGLYNKYDALLKQLNRRVGMLQQYAPGRLYELRERLNERLGEEPLPPFNEALANDWRERAEGVDERMVRVALRATAYEHIESIGADGWRPLLNGGLTALRILATTDALDETFPGVGDEHAVRAWTHFIDSQLEKIAGTPDSNLNSQRVDSLLDSLRELNARTLELPEEVLLREFGDGAMFELGAAKEDEYSDIIWPDEVRRFRQATEGNFVGVGILIRHNERRDIVVVNPLEGTPAFRAGIRPDDVIVQVNGNTTVGWTLNDAVDRITGKRDTEVTLGIKREGVDDIIEYDITREVINLPSVKGWHKTKLDEHGDPVWNWFIDPVNRIGYVRLTGFSESTYDELRAAWDEMKAQGVDGLILDLRHNPGGLLDQAVKVVNLFVGRGEVVSIEGKRPGDKESLHVDPARVDRLASRIPLVVLVNKGSASASEIVSGALQAHEAAIVVGTRTWGKGSVQRVYGIARNAQLKLTTQYYRLPPGPGEEIGRIVHKRPNSTEWGVEPDVTVDMTELQVIEALNLRDAADTISNVEDAEKRPDVNELITKGVDPQLQTALLILQAKAVGDLGVEHARLD